MLYFLPFRFFFYLYILFLDTIGLDRASPMAICEEWDCFKSVIPLNCTPNASRVCFVSSPRGQWTILNEVFCLFLSVNDRSLDICNDERFEKDISDIRSIVHWHNFVNKAAKTCPSAQNGILTMGDTVKVLLGKAKAKKVKSRVDYIIRY